MNRGKDGTGTLGGREEQKEEGARLAPWCPAGGSVVGEAHVGAPSALGGSSQDLAQEMGSSTQQSGWSQHHPTSCCPTKGLSQPVAGFSVGWGRRDRETHPVTLWWGTCWDLSIPCTDHTAAARSAVGACRNEMGLRPLKAGECSQDPLKGSQDREGRRDPQNKAPGELMSEGSEGGAQQAGLRLDGTLTLSGGGRCVGEEGTGTEPNPAPVGAAEPAAGAWCGSVQWGRGGAWEQGFQSQGKAAPQWPRSRRHCKWSLFLLRGLLGDALLFLLLQFLGSAPWFPPWSGGNFPRLGCALILASLWSAPRSLRSWHFTGLLRRLLARPAPASLLSAIFFLLGGQGLAGL